jgi:hypothetical protein
MATQNHHLFSLGQSISGVPVAVEPATLKDLGALELRDLERWVKATPRLLGEELLVVTSQLAESEHFRDRLDVLAMDRAAHERWDSNDARRGPRIARRVRHRRR